MIRCRRRKISRETRCGANEQRCAAATQKREKARGPKPSRGSAFVKTNMARQPGVCPKRHARLSATMIKHPKCQKVAKMGAGLAVPAVSGDGALILLRLREGGLLGGCGLGTRRFAGASLRSELKQALKLGATFVPQASSNVEIG